MRDTGNGIGKNRSKSAAAILGLAAFVFITLWVQQTVAQIRIMPLGDSLTTGLPGQASYRYWLWKRLKAANYQVNFVGSNWGVGQESPPRYSDFDADNEGHPSDTTDDILYALRSWTTAARPDVVLMLVGATDFERGRSVPYVLGNAARIINTLRSVNPHVVIIWAMLPRGKNPTREEAYNAAVPHLASSWSGPRSPIHVANLWSGFLPSLDTVDGQHPNQAGEKIMANGFYVPLVSVLGALGQGR